jgi:hypothetical protein
LVENEYPVEFEVGIVRKSLGLSWKQS